MVKKLTAVCVVCLIGLFELISYLFPIEPSQVKAQQEKPACNRSQHAILMEQAINYNRIHQQVYVGTDGQPDISERDFEWVACVVYAEAAGKSTEVQREIAAIVFKRVVHSDFPNSIREVLLQPGAFNSVCENGEVRSNDENQKIITFDMVPKSTISAVREAYLGNALLGGVLYFSADPLTGETVFSKEPIE